MAIKMYTGVPRRIAFSDIDLESRGLTFSTKPTVTFTLVPDDDGGAAGLVGEIEITDPEYVRRYKCSPHTSDRIGARDIPGGATIYLQQLLGASEKYHAPLSLCVAAHMVFWLKDTCYLRAQIRYHSEESVEVIIWAIRANEIVYEFAALVPRRDIAHLLATSEPEDDAATAAN